MKYLLIKTQDFVMKIKFKGKKNFNFDSIKLL